MIRESVIIFFIPPTLPRYAYLVVNFCVGFSAHTVLKTLAVSTDADDLLLVLKL